MRSLWIACAIACSVPQDAPAPLQDLEGPIPHEASEHSPLPDPQPSLDPATMCGRAEVCCRAFVSATPNVVEAIACAGPAEAAAESDADERCARMMAGWRTALERNPEVEAPPQCSPADE